MTVRQLAPLIFFSVAFLAIGAGIGSATNAGKDAWYNGLIKSTLTPPDAAFGIVWSVLYLLLAIVAWMLWCRKSDPALRRPTRLFWAQMVLNWGWSFMFFTLQQTALAFFWIVALTILIALTIRTLWPVSRRAAFLMLPYQLWVGFAAYLSMVIWIHN